MVGKSGLWIRRGDAVKDSSKLMNPLIVSFLVSTYVLLCTNDINNNTNDINNNMSSNHKAQGMA